MPHRWGHDVSNLNYTPVLSGKSEKWSGRKGLVHKAIVEDYSDLSSFDVYACGSPAMIEAARRDFVDIGLDPDRFFYDAFTISN